MPRPCSFRITLKEQSAKKLYFTPNDPTELRLFSHEFFPWIFRHTSLQRIQLFNPTGLIHLIKSHHMLWLGWPHRYTILNNKYVCQILLLQKKSKGAPRGKLHWHHICKNKNYKRSWLLPPKRSPSHKIKDIYFKIIHKMYCTQDAWKLMKHLFVYFFLMCTELNSLLALTQQQKVNPVCKDS